MLPVALGSVLVYVPSSPFGFLFMKRAQGFCGVRDLEVSAQAISHPFLLILYRALFLRKREEDTHCVGEGPRKTFLVMSRAPGHAKPGLPQEGRSSQAGFSVRSSGYTCTWLGMWQSIWMYKALGMARELAQYFLMEYLL